jgi:hypothetical protein
VSAAGEVYDLDAAKAAQREALGEPLIFSSGGQKFLVPPSAEWPVHVSALLAEGNIQGAVKDILDVGEPGTAERFLATRPTMGHVNLIIEEAARRENLDLPNSSGPQPPDSPPT